MKITLRKSKLKENRFRLYLDYYPARYDPVKRKNVSYENLKLFTYEQPVTDAQRQHNRETQALAERICAQRQLDVQSRLHGFIPDYQRQQSFIDYFKRVANRQRGMNRHNWDSSIRYFEQFAGKDIRFMDIDLSLCEDFKAFLRNGPKLREKRAGIGHNSALSYYNKFRNALRLAYREKYLTDDFFTLSPGLKEKEAHVEFLTLADVQLLAATPLENDLCRRVILFGILTGLRFADIKYLTWSELRGTAGNYYLQFRQRKTLKTQHMPISDQAAALMGEPGPPNKEVFKGLYYNQVRDQLVLWPAAAGLTKHLTFSCLRHTYATLQLNHGTDIYTVSKMLGHRHVKTTQRYTRLLEDKKRETTGKIILDLSAD